MVTTGSGCINTDVAGVNNFDIILKILKISDTVYVLLFDSDCYVSLFFISKKHSDHHAGNNVTCVVSHMSAVHGWPIPQQIWFIKWFLSVESNINK